MATTAPFGAESGRFQARHLPCCFGTAVANSLVQLGHYVLAVDNRAEVVHALTGEAVFVVDALPAHPGTVADDRL